MPKITDLGLLPPDHPVYNGGVETFSVRRSKPPKTSSTDEKRYTPEEVQEDITNTLLELSRQSSGEPGEAE